MNPTPYYGQQQMSTGIRSAFGTNVVQDLAIRQSTVLKIVGALILLVIGFVLYKFWLAPKLAGLFKTKVKLPDQNYNPSGGGVSTDFVNKEMPSIVTSLNSALTSTCFTICTERCDAMKRFNGLMDNQKVAVSNAYKNTYRNTLRTDVTAIERDGCASLFGFGDDQYGTMIKNLDRLNL